MYWLRDYQPHASENSRCEILWETPEKTFGIALSQIIVNLKDMDAQLYSLNCVDMFTNLRAARVYTGESSRTKVRTPVTEDTLVSNE